MLHQSAALVGWGRVRGRLQRFKRYTGIVLEPTARKWIPGEIYRLADNRILAALDRYEGAEFERVVINVARAEGSRLPCWIYQVRLRGGTRSVPS